MSDLQALEGKDVKDLLLNVGSGGGAAAASASSGGAASGEAAPEAAKEEEKVEGKIIPEYRNMQSRRLTHSYRQGGVRRGYGLRSLRLSAFFVFPVFTLRYAWPRFHGATAGMVAFR